MISPLTWILSLPESEHAKLYKHGFVFLIYEQDKIFETECLTKGTNLFCQKLIIGIF